MRKIDITGGNYSGEWKKMRVACRGIVTDGDRILLSYETKTDKWMIPGGGLEENETDRDCCIREISEETGMLVEPSECLLEIDEYYENEKYVNRYFLCKVTGTTEIKLTETETRLGMEPRWLPACEIKEIFSKHDSYADTDEERRGVYLREFTALSELL